jgi:D-alanyl-D-alanine carboxypeptidase
MAGRIRHHEPTTRPLRQARPLQGRARRTRRLPRVRRTSAAGLVLSLAVLVASALALPPAPAGDAEDFRPIVLRSPDEGVAAANPGASERRTAAGGMVALPEEPFIDEAAFARALEAARVRAEADGVTFAAVVNGTLVWSGSSGTGRDGETPLTADAPMVIGSLTKTFVAAAVLQLADEGRLELDDRLAEHLPGLDGVGEAITIRQLLDHSSGLADVFNDDTRRGLEDDPGRAWTPPEVLATLRAPWYAPGEGWAYANTNYFLLGLLVERLTGATLPDVLAERFLGPLSLDGTRVLTGAEGDPLGAAWTTIFWASGAMAAPAVDLAAWGDALYRGDILAPGTRAAMLPTVGSDYGLGVQRLRIGGVSAYGHTGLLDSYTALLAHLPEFGVTLAILVNRSHAELGAMLRTAPDGGGRSLLDLALGLAGR